MKSRMILSEEEIISRIVSGEKHLFENLMRKYNQRLYRMSKAIVQEEEEIEDVMQTAYLNAYRKLSSFEGKSSFSTWLTRIVIHESLLSRKKKAKRRQMLIDKQYEDPHRDTPLKSLMNVELKSLLEKAVLDLPEKYRLVFVAREMEEMSIVETMEVLHLSESNVKVRLTRAKEMLRNDLSHYYRSTQLFEFNLLRCDKVVHQVMEQINR